MHGGSAGVSPDHLLTRRHLEDRSGHSITNERISAWKPLGTGHEWNGKVGLATRSKAPDRLFGTVDFSRLACVSIGEIERKDDLIHRRVIAAWPAEAVVKDQDMPRSGTARWDPVRAMRCEEPLIGLRAGAIGLWVSPAI